MKPAQWIIALLVLAVMVFVITFAMNFLGESGTKDSGKPLTDKNAEQSGEAILTFPEMSFPGNNFSYEQEKKHAGYHDFLFGNPTKEEVTVGLYSVDCSKCTSVELLLASNDLKPRLEPVLNRVLIPDALVWALQDNRVREAASKLESSARLEIGKEQKVPPEAVGWFRIRWTDDQIGVKQFNAVVWAKDKKGTAYTKLEAKVHFADPVNFEDTEIALDEMKVEDLQNRQKPKTADFKLWSTTRSQLHPKATLLSRWQSGAAPIVVGELEPMKPSEIRGLEKELQKSNMQARVACAYHLSVTLLDRSPDGKQPFPFGNFRTRIRLTFDDEGIEPIIILINGKLHGDVGIRGGIDGRLSFGSFNTASGSSFQHVMLYSDVKGLELEIDRERTPQFLLKNAKIEKVEASESDTTWKVSTKVPKDSVVGQFPREDNEYFDCAVYVKTKNDSSRSLRIPADGIAVLR